MQPVQRHAGSWLATVASAMPMVALESATCDGYENGYHRQGDCKVAEASTTGAARALADSLTSAAWLRHQLVHLFETSGVTYVAESAVRLCARMSLCSARTEHRTMPSPEVCSGTLLTSLVCIAVKRRVTAPQDAPCMLRCSCLGPGPGGTCWFRCTCSSLRTSLKVRNCHHVASSVSRYSCVTLLYLCDPFARYECT